jgi:hypothetical protein
MAPGADQNMPGFPQSASGLRQSDLLGIGLENSGIQVGSINRSVYRKTYMRAKGGMFKSKGYLESYLKEHKMME